MKRTLTSLMTAAVVAFAAVSASAAVSITLGSPDPDASYAPGDDDHVGGARDGERRCGFEQCGRQHLVLGCTGQRERSVERAARAARVQWTGPRLHDGPLPGVQPDHASGAGGCARSDRLPDLGNALRRKSGAGGRLGDQLHLADHADERIGHSSGHSTVREGRSVKSREGRFARGAEAPHVRAASGCGRRCGRRRR